MTILVASVPHTGTRFLVNLLDKMGVCHHGFIHTYFNQVESLKRYCGLKVVVPVRDPLLCFMSHYFRAEPVFSDDVDHSVENVLSSLVSAWAGLKYLEDKLEDIQTHRFSLNPENSQDELQKLESFVGKTVPSDFVWKQVGVGMKSKRSIPSDYSYWDDVKSLLSSSEMGLLSDSLGSYRARYGFEDGRI